MKLSAILKQPSAFLPVVMSLIALTIVLGHIAVYGAMREPDEGAAAHIFQLLIAAQIPIIGFFALKWLPKIPRQAISILMLQFVSVFAALAPVVWFKL